MTESTIEPAPGRRLFRVVRILLLLALLGAMAAWAVQWARTAVLYVHETDARVMADLVTISSEVDGRLVELPVREGDRVDAGQVLARLDARAARALVVEIAAERDALLRERERVAAEAAVIAANIKARLESGRARLSEAEANEGIHVHELGFAEGDFRRIEQLAASGTVPASRLERARTDFLKRRQELERAEAATATARADLAETRALQAELDVKQAETEELDARIARVEARIGLHRIGLGNRTIRSPAAGVVGRVFVAEGEFLVRGQRMLMMHDPERVWIETNIRETELARLAVGQPARIVVDAYPDETFTGVVGRIGTAATSQFALLPRLNESGTFTKVTQRVRVRIDLANGSSRLKPGMMVEIYVDDGTAARLAPWLTWP